MRITATMTLVRLPSRMAEKARSKPSFTEPSTVLPERISSRMRSAVMTLASTPMPMLRMMPAMPGRVRVKEGISGSSRVTDATMNTTCPSRASTPTKPGSRYFSSMKMATRAKAMIPASTMTSLAPRPRVGEMEL